jgi:hypothetical protein
MNERIKELAEKAEEVVFYSPSTGKETKEVNLEKFAELIVTKCAVIATRCESNGNKNIGAEILEHFGV